MEEKLVVVGAKENNLKNLSVTLPRNKFIVFTGVSGSGKSTLAFDTIFAEGERKFMESLSSYARQFLGQMEKPNVTRIDGLSPCIAIDQKTTSQNPRSTVGTITEIYDYFRLLFANIGKPYCPNCNRLIEKQSIDQIMNSVLSYGDGTKLIISSPMFVGKKGTFINEFEKLRKSGYSRVDVDGKIFSLDEDIVLDKNKKHNISVVIDRVILKSENYSRIAESIEIALKLSDGKAVINHNDVEELFSNKFACPECGFSFSEISPRLFSFNTPYGACKTCAGLGIKKEIDANLVIGDRRRSLREGACTVSGWNLSSSDFTKVYFNALSKYYNFSLDTPFKDLPKDIQDMILYGNNGEELEIEYKSGTFVGSYIKSFEGVIPNLERRFRTTTSEYTKQEIGKYMKDMPCECCHGQRLNKEALSVKIGGKNIFEVTDMSIAKIKQFLSNVKLTEEQQLIGKDVLKEINARLDFLLNVGLDYLTLTRSASTLSGGEAQRIRLATQIGSGLVGVLYVLDEPSIGLHQRDNLKLISTLKNLRDLGNTLIVVEHDEDTIRNADYIVDIGPYAGIHGGEVVAEGTFEQILKSKQSLTAKYLRKELEIPIPSERRKGNGNYLEVIGAKQNNLKNISVKFPLGELICITGVSGSGKSSLVNEILYPALSNRLNGSKLTEGRYEDILGLENVDKVICIDQTPIGRTPRSNPATYTGLFNYIRDLFANTPDAKAKGYKSGRFSFNVAGGRCEACEGNGTKQIEMYFLPDVSVPCEVCHGKRYNKETLEVKYKGKNIYDVLEMTVENALSFFENLPSLRNKLKNMYDVGLGYIKLGQSATTLSGGEAQRVKLATELAKIGTGKTVYILDEPTTGLHSYDVDKLVGILQRLVAEGNTVIVIEHNLDVIKVADYIIDLGPEGGDGGGTIIATGTPEKIAEEPNSYTGHFLKEILNNKLWFIIKKLFFWSSHLRWSIFI